MQQGCNRGQQHDVAYLSPSKMYHSPTPTAHSSHPTPTPYPSPLTPETDLSILARVGLFDEDGRDFTICQKHRDQLGVKFKASIKCQHPLHGNCKGKRERGVNMRMSKEIKSKWNVVVPVGAGKTLCLFILSIQLQYDSYLDLFPA